MNDEPMMPPPKCIGNVRIEIGKKTPLWPVQNLHTPPHGKPVLPPIKGRSMTQEEIEKCRNDFYESSNQVFPSQRNNSICVKDLVEKHSNFRTPSQPINYEKLSFRTYYPVTYSDRTA